MKTSTLAIILVLVLIGAGAVYLLSGDRLFNGQEASPSPSPAAVQPNISDMIYLEKPSVGELESVKSPLLVSGRARGNWYFEASFPIRILDANNKELGVAVAQAQGEWMTTEFVPFSTVLNFSKPTTQTGTLVLEKDNPSGLPENDASLRIPVRFDLAGWDEPDGKISQADCRPTGCSGQLCSDEDVVTTCEFKEEYACYKSAKCERQEDGKCGWTPSEELVACLYTAWGAEGEL